VTTAAFSCSELRIDVDGAALIDGLSCHAAHDRVGLVGAWEPLFRYLTGRATLARGSCTLLGMDAREAVQSARVGVACCDVPLPPHWSAAEYLERGAELAGRGARQARAVTRGCLEQLGIAALAARRLSSLSLPERRAVSVAQAAVTGPEALLVEAPLAELDENAQAFVVAVLQRAAVDRRLVCSVRTAPAAGVERGLLDSMQTVLILESGRLLAEGPPAELLSAGAVYRVSALGDAARFTAELERRGCRIFAMADAPTPNARLLVILPDGAAPNAILDAALDVDAAVIEMVPDQATLDALRAT
jgi:ABC-type multidrug transport system ATPase subunit